VQLTDPVLECVALVALEHIVSKRAMQYADRDTTRSPKGSLVVALDECAKAVAVMLSRVVADEKRTFRVMHDSTSAVNAAKPGLAVRRPDEAAALLPLRRSRGLRKSGAIRSARCGP
jgi:hypothetical protein